MRVYLKFIATTLLSLVAIASPVFESNIKGNSLSSPGDIKVKNIKPQSFPIKNTYKRGIDGNTPGEKAQYHFDYLAGSLRKYVKNDSIDFPKFERDKAEHMEGLEWTEKLVYRDLPQGAFGGEIAFSHRFLDAFKNASETKDRFADCNFTGSNLVEKMMELNIRILALNDFDSLGEPHIKDFASKRSDLEAKLKVLKCTTEEMDPRIKIIFKEQAEIANDSLQFLKRYDDDEKKEARPEVVGSSSGKKKECFL